MTFTDKLTRAVQSSGSVLCAGLDPDPDRIPKPLRDQIPDEGRLIFEFCRRVIEAVKPHVCAFKPNLAFFEALGAPGWNALEQVIDSIPSNRVVIADAKRGDIGNTAGKYREAFFDRLGADAITLNPLMGMDTIQPFTHYPDKAVFVLTLTSNEGAADFFKQRIEGGSSLSQYIAGELSRYQVQSAAHLGMVLGATQTTNLQPLLKAHPNAHLLIPGVGTQGGSIPDLEKVLENHKGVPIINSSRSILYAGRDNEDWIRYVTDQAVQLKESLHTISSRYAKKAS
ncbi:orotidine-5'-phosphate decarboxylase [Rhodohalobacter mucosus]|uniref:Orotidine-5'-phosphate decarboxylase n=1 Tax=Rhodohalobacter mucosus TaxID=2079485 RepID=A0A316TLD5_9BACT|nr:orotidine-5'-phosphate decarboxylase [Rhodohalobacter mucosus]PWN05393.1 orotidine-5'-phosphate decarboxylase [Rhodohalobacter mucosus]